MGDEKMTLHDVERFLWKIATPHEGYHDAVCAAIADAEAMRAEIKRLRAECHRLSFALGNVSIDRDDGGSAMRRELE